MKKTKEPISTSSIQLATSLANIFEIICNAKAGLKIGQDREYKKKFVTYSFIYSFIWSSCVTATDKYH